ncbi:MAG TPA: hypothetical protein VFQ58_04945 [Flavisolibacter sp.]|nr:hypothetical protein [Flavisolibacter sp.]
MTLLFKKWTFLLTTIITSLFSIASYAQDKGTDINVNINKGSGNWYAQPWVWVVGAAIFILLLVALLRRNSSRE